MVMRLYKFRNINASSIRTVMIARCPENETLVATGTGAEGQSSDPESQDVDMSMKGAETSQSECSQGKGKRKENRLAISQKVQVMTDGDRGVRFLEVDDSNGEVEETIEYNSDYRMAETNQAEHQQLDEQGASNYAGCFSVDFEELGEAPAPEFYPEYDQVMNDDSDRDACRPRRRRREDSKDKRPHSDSGASQCGDDSWKHKASRSVPQKPQKQPNGTHDTNVAHSSTACKRSGCGRRGTSLHGPGGDINVNTNSTGNNNDSYFRVHRRVTATNSSPTPPPPQPPPPPPPLPSPPPQTIANGHVGESSYNQLDAGAHLPEQGAGEGSSSRRTSSCRMSGLDLTDVGDKYLIFTTGMTTYTPHQIGIKRIRSLEDVSRADVKQSPEGLRLLPNVADHELNLQREEFDTVDHLIELHGHIIGMCLSPDHR